MTTEDELVFKYAGVEEDLVLKVSAAILYATRYTFWRGRKWPSG